MEWDYGVDREPGVPLKPYAPFVDGRFLDGTDTSSTALNPATDEPLVEVGTAGPGEVDRAVEVIAEVMDGQLWDLAEYRQRAAVT